MEQETVIQIKSYLEKRKAKEELKAIKGSLKVADLKKYDIGYNGPLSKKEIIRTIIFGIILIIIGIPLCVLTAINNDNFCAEDAFCLESKGRGLQLLVNILFFGILFLIINIAAGICSIKTHIDVGYTRKIMHFCSFFLPFAANKVFPIGDSYFITVIKFWIVLIVFLLITKPLRRLLILPLIIFRAIDRPVDRPYTILWLVSQFIASSIVLAGLSILWSHLDFKSDNLLIILVLIVGLGDGLAEPVGIMWGKHKYRTRAIYYRRKLCSGSFTRSFEGSATVFIMSCIAIAIFYASFTSLQLLITFLLLPIIMTLTEAISPRTWDSPFMFLVGGLMLTGIKFIPGGF